MNIEAAYDALSGFNRRVIESGRRPNPAELGKAARDAGVPFAHFINLLPRLSLQYGHKTSPAPSELRAFVTALASVTGCRAILEIGDEGEVFCATAIADRADIDAVYVTKVSELADAVAEFGSPPRLWIKNSLSEVEATERFDLIIAHPPLGTPPARESGADGYGGEAVKALLPRLADAGRLIWVTGRGALRDERVKANRRTWVSQGFSTQAEIDLPAGWAAYGAMPGIVVVLTRARPERRLIAILREQGVGETVGKALLNGPTKKLIQGARWVEADGSETYSDLERRQAIAKLMPKGRHPRIVLAELMIDGLWERADKVTDDHGGAAYVYVPEYATSRVTTRLDEQTVSPKAVRRVAIDAAKVNPAFLARVLNSPLGKALREDASRGATIQRIDPKLLEAKVIPLPDLPTQDRIVRLHADMAAVNSIISERLRSLDEDWSELDEVADDIDRLKGVLDVDRRIDEWWHELPYPLATIYRRHRMTTDPREQFGAMLHFFEVFAVYLASLGVSHLRAARSDAAEVVDKLLYGSRSGLERTDFGYWIQLAAACFAELRRTMHGSLRDAASEFGGPSLIAALDSVTAMSKAPQLLDRPREIRNSTTGHGGYVKDTDAVRLNGELQTVLRDLFAETAVSLRKARLVRIGSCQMRGEHNVYQADLLQGSDPTFKRLPVESRRRADSGTLAVWYPQFDELVARVPFFRLGAPKDPAESTVYVYNRVETGGLRWVSYQEARDQDILLADDGLDGLIRVRPVGPS